MQHVLVPVQVITLRRILLQRVLHLRRRHSARQITATVRLLVRKAGARHLVRTVHTLRQKKRHVQRLVRVIIVRRTMLTMAVRQHVRSVRKTIAVVRRQVRKADAQRLVQTVHTLRQEKRHVPRLAVVITVRRIP